jgi:hypothetical protein
MKPNLRIVDPTQTERTFGSRRFIALDRNPGLPQPDRFEPTVTRAGDIVI